MYLPPPSGSFAISSRLGSLKSLTVMSVQSPMQTISDLTSSSFNGVTSMQATSYSRVVSLLNTSFDSLI